ncbi:hypothetical protein [Evansella tamaricis]|uniref:Uncharacterized protein n=1 Tax=Evansella tamaricis TaxID=2069301 RepID=A0ABS6JLT4_9BACI|nr:hypothetical protein [Evansella tamaricis]MBU9714640.1 hypothetical protein [Evansella tamaricis]
MANKSTLKDRVLKSRVKKMVPASQLEERFQLLLYQVEQIERKLDTNNEGKDAEQQEHQGEGTREKGLPRPLMAE